jgi:hypothetical protein
MDVPDVTVGDYPAAREHFVTVDQQLGDIVKDIYGAYTSDDAAPVDTLRMGVDGADLHVVAYANVNDRVPNQYTRGVIGSRQRIKEAYPAANEGLPTIEALSKTLLHVITYEAIKTAVDPASPLSVGWKERDEELASKYTRRFENDLAMWRKHDLIPESLRFRVVPGVPFSEN